MINARTWRLALGTESARNNGLTALLIMEAFTLFIAAPLAALGFHFPLLLGSSICAPLLITIVLISRSPGARVLVTIAAGLAVGSAVFRINHPSLVTFWLAHLAGMTALSAISLVIVQAVFAAGRITYHRLEGAIILYLNIALAFTSVYRLILELDPAAFTPIASQQNEAAAATSMLYFSFTTLTSTGFGEILPTNPFARSMANLEFVLGQLYLAIMLARLVTMQGSPRRD